MIFDYRRAMGLKLVPDAFVNKGDGFVGDTCPRGCLFGRALTAAYGIDIAYGLMTTYNYRDVLKTIFGSIANQEDSTNPLSISALERRLFWSVEYPTYGQQLERWFADYLVSQGHTVILEDETILEPNKDKNVQESVVKELVLV